MADELDLEKPGVKMGFTRRWKAEGRLAEVDAFRRGCAEECEKRGMLRSFARAHAWREAVSKFPPLSEEEFAAIQAERNKSVRNGVDPDTGEARGGRNKITGLDRVPAEWGELPASASFRAELQWVNANRLAMITELSSGTTRVSLAKAQERAPSRSALGWLELAITNRAKFMDLLARTSGGGDDGDDAEGVRRERKSLAEIEGLLRQMQAENPVELLRRLVAVVEGSVDEAALSEAKSFLEKQ